MKYAAAVLALLCGVTQQKVDVQKLNNYPSDEELNTMDLSYYKTEELDNLGVNAAMDLMANHEKTPHTIKNINHLQHRIEVWEQKQATLDLMKEKMLDAEDDMD